MVTSSSPLPDVPPGRPGITAGIESDRERELGRGGTVEPTASPASDPGRCTGAVLEPVSASFRHGALTALQIVERDPHGAPSPSVVPGHTEQPGRRVPNELRCSQQGFPHATFSELDE
jgi:hypothetical protein